MDSSAALAVVARKGTGKLRHFRVGQLWVQELAENDEVKFRKVKGEENPADVCTKHLVRAKMDVLLELISLQDRQGRADVGLEVSMLIWIGDNYPGDSAPPLATSKL